MIHKVIKVGGMSCDHCKRAVEGVLLDLPGVHSVEADVRMGRVHIGMERELPEDLLRSAIAEVGYEWGE